LKERRSVNKPLTDDMRIKNIKELDNMRDILSKTKRKPNEDEKIINK
jgi:hypothetical protein